MKTVASNRTRQDLDRVLRQLEMTEVEALEWAANKPARYFELDKMENDLLDEVAYLSGLNR